MTPSSAQYSCPTVTHSLLSPPFFLFLPPVWTTSSHAQLSGFPPSCERKAVSCQFSLNIFHSTCLLMKEPRLVWHTHSHTFMHHISAAEWLTDNVRLEHLLPADSSALTNRMIRLFIIHSSPTSPPLSTFFYLSFAPSTHHIPFSPFNHLYLVACVFFCAFACLCAREQPRVA